jgi:hypothetical protein
MKTKKIFFLIICLLLLSCEKKAKTPNIENNKKHITQPKISAYEYEKKYIVPDIPLIDKSDMNSLFLKLIKNEQSVEIKTINKNKRFLFVKSGKDVFKLFFKKSIPQKAGEYINDSPFCIYDIIYVDEKQYKIAIDNLKHELNKLNVNNNYEYFDYFKGSESIFFFDSKSKKITFVVLSGIKSDNNHNIIRNFCTIYKNKFDQIVFAYATGTDEIK